MRLQHLVGCSLILLGCVAAQTATAGSVRQLSDPKSNGDLKPTGKGYGVVDLLEQPKSTGHAASGKTAASNGIVYHGGPVMLGTTNVYYIWYGNWSGNTATSILPALAGGMGGSPYYNINTSYFDGTGAKISNAVHYSGSRNDNYSQGKALSDAQIQTIVSSAITGGLPKDTNAVYFVLTSSDVTATSGFCNNYCGWHTHGLIGGRDIKSAFVGHPDRCPTSCEEQTTSPNGNAGADGMASIISHELEEAASDPQLNAWYDRRGQENADKCAWTFGTEYNAANGSKANVKLGGLDFLIQRNWVNASGGYCSMSL